MALLRNFSVFKILKIVPESEKGRRKLCPAYKSNINRPRKIQTALAPLGYDMESVVKEEEGSKIAEELREHLKGDRPEARDKQEVSSERETGEQRNSDETGDISMEEINKVISESFNRGENTVKEIGSQETVRKHADEDKEEDNYTGESEASEKATASKRRRISENNSEKDTLSSSQVVGEEGRNNFVEGGDEGSLTEADREKEQRSGVDNGLEMSPHDIGDIQALEKDLATSFTRDDNQKTTTEGSESMHNTDSEKVQMYHGDLVVPADSELLNTNTAYNAYSNFSSQVSSPTILANANLTALPMSIVASGNLPPRIQLLVNSLPVLDNLATQLLRIVAEGPHQKIFDLAAHPDTPAGATYRDLTSLFEFTKRLYSEEDPFLTVEHLAPGMWREGENTPSIFKNKEQLIELTLRKVNMATFLGAALGTIEIGFFYLNEAFLDIFCPANRLDQENSLSNISPNNLNLQSSANACIGEKIGKLLKPQASLYLDLKTQAYISAIEAGERSKAEILEDILPSNMEQILLARRKTKVLTPAEYEFLERFKARKETLLNHPDDKLLSEDYDWVTFLRDLFDYTSKNMAFLIWGKKEKSTREKPVPKDDLTSHNVSGPSQDYDTFSTEERDEKTATSGHTTNANDNSSSQLSSQGIDTLASTLLPSEIQEQQIHLHLNPKSTAKSSHRRPWTRDEEKALRHALELRGPAWSTILELFGAGGKISEALKNRNQVQLKDKARNWKMFFLKLGLPVPGYLQKVTGDLEREDKLKAKKAAKNKQSNSKSPLPPSTQESTTST